MRKLALLLAAATVALSGCFGDSIARWQPKPTALAHNVYFALHDSSQPARDRLVRDCHRYLRDHPGIRFFAAGTIVEEHAREVNARDWDVGLHIVFESKQDHDLYQNAPDHQRFIELNQQNWKAVRVYDTYIE